MVIGSAKHCWSVKYNQIKKVSRRFGKMETIGDLDSKKLSGNDCRILVGAG